MPTSPSPDSITHEDPASDRVTEAEVIANLLLDMDVPLTARLDEDQLLFQVSDATPSGAIELIRIAAKRFNEDEQFREDMIAYLGAVGDYVHAAPGIPSDLQTADAITVFAALADCGLACDAKMGGLDGTWPFLTLMPWSGGKTNPNAHLLIDLVRRRFDEEPEFQRAAIEFRDDMRACKDGRLVKSAAKTRRTKAA